MAEDKKKTLTGELSKKPAKGETIIAEKAKRPRPWPDPPPSRRPQASSGGTSKPPKADASPKKPPKKG